MQCSISSSDQPRDNKSQQRPCSVWRATFQCDPSDCQSPGYLSISFWSNSQRTVGLKLEDIWPGWTGQCWPILLNPQSGFSKYSSTVVASSSWRQLCLSVDVHLASSLFRFPHLVSRRPLCLHWFPPFRKRTSSLVPPTALALVSSLASAPTLPTLDQLDKVAASNSGDHPPLPPHHTLGTLFKRQNATRVQKRRGQKCQI